MTHHTSGSANRAAIAAAVFLVAEILTSLILPRGPVSGLRYLGAACGVTALPLMFLPMFTLRRHGGIPAGGTYMNTTRVVERGLFALARHPQYAGYILLAATFALISQHPATVALSVGALAGIVRWTVREERDLHERHGPGYGEYAARVPRFNLVAGLLRYLRRPARPPRR